MLITISGIRATVPKIETSDVFVCTMNTLSGLLVHFSYRLVRGGALVLVVTYYVFIQGNEVNIRGHRLT